MDNQDLWSKCQELDKFGIDQIVEEYDAQTVINAGNGNWGFQEIGSDIQKNIYGNFEGITESGLTPEEIYGVEELTDEEAEDVTGGGYALAGVSMQTDAQKKGYSKHCGGIRLATNSSSISVTQVGARLGKIDKIYITQSSIPVTCMISGPMGGPDTIQVVRRTSRKGLATIEIWGHQKGEPKNYRYVVLRVQFN